MLSQTPALDSKHAIFLGESDSICSVAFRPDDYIIPQSSFVATCPCYGRKKGNNSTRVRSQSPLFCWRVKAIPRTAVIKPKPEAENVHYICVFFTAIHPEQLSSNNVNVRTPASCPCNPIPRPLSLPPHPPTTARWLPNSTYRLHDRQLISFANFESPRFEKLSCRKFLSRA